MSCLCCGLVYQPVYLRHVARAVMYSGRVLELHVLCVQWYVNLYISALIVCAGVRFP